MSDVSQEVALLAECFAAVLRPANTGVGVAVENRGTKSVSAEVARITDQWRVHFDTGASEHWRDQSVVLRASDGDERTVPGADRRPPTIARVLFPLLLPTWGRPTDDWSIVSAAVHNNVYRLRLAPNQARRDPSPFSGTHGLLDIDQNSGFVRDLNVWSDASNYYRLRFTPNAHDNDSRPPVKFLGSKSIRQRDT